MKIIAIASVTAGGKTTVVNALKRQLKNAQSLHFDDDSFDGAVDNFYAWIKQGANYQVWDLSPLIRDICEIKRASTCDYLLLDYPFAYCHKALSNYIDCAIFIDTPLDIALARRVLRDMKDAFASEIQENMRIYIKCANHSWVSNQPARLPQGAIG